MRLATGMLLIGITLCPVKTWAAQSEIAGNSWEIAPEIYYYDYQEPDVNVEFEGAMYGLGGSFAHHNANHLMLKAEGRGAYGTVDYTGSGTIDGIQDYALEGRINAGYDFLMGNNGVLTPYFGVGYRYLNDDSSGKTSSTGAAGYERESNYFYSPIGVEYSKGLNDNWKFGVNVEYDIFWTGTQYSHLEDVNSGFNTVSNKQNNGYGIRGSIKFQKTSEKFDLVLEPFVRWWSIRDSENANVTFGGTIVGLGYEPKNETLEVGGRIGIKF